MLAATSVPDLIALLNPWFAKFGWFRFHQANLGLAAERTELPSYSFRASEGGVKNRHAVHASAPGAQVTRLRIDSTEGKGLKGCLCAGLAHLADQPFGGCV